MRLASSPYFALYLGRIVMVALALALMGLALWVGVGLLCRWTLLVGLILAVPPTALHSMASLSSSGPETAAGIGWWVGLLAASEEPANRRTWLLTGVSGAILACARTSGPLFIIYGLLTIACLRGVPQIWRCIRVGGRAAWAAIAAVAAGLGLGAGWQLTQQPTYETALTSNGFHLGPLLDTTWALMQRMVALFGWGEVSPPASVRLLYGFGILALVVAAAMRVHSVRQGAALLVTIVGTPLIIALILTFGLGAGVIQGRWFLAANAGLPIMAAWLAGGRTEGARRSITPTLRIAGIAGVASLAGAWYVNAHNYAVGGDGSPNFVSGAVWSPPFGWLTWVAVAFIATVLLVVAVVLPPPPKLGSLSTRQPTVT